MILAADVSYRGREAIAAGVLFRGWQDAEPAAELTVRIDEPAAYEPGQFWKRELPPVLALLRQLQQLPGYIIIDGHVYLDAGQRPGFGKHLYDALQGKAAVIGVAKSRYKDTPPDAEVFRGGSKRPLYVTSVGIDPAEARAAIARMHGEHRLPAMLKRADRLSRMGPVSEP